MLSRARRVWKAGVAAWRGPVRRRQDTGWDDRFRGADWSEHLAFQYNADVLRVMCAVERELLKDSDVQPETLADLVAEDVRRIAHEATVRHVLALRGQA